MNINSYRNPELIEWAVKDIAKLSQGLPPVKIMEVCGTHTMSIGKWGIRNLLPGNIKLISGPGCPVCVTPSSVIDELISLPEEVAIATFGDLIKVPGTKGTLEEARARGTDIRIVYSPLQALEIAKAKETVFAGIGFETTIPGIAYSIIEAQNDNLEGFSVFSQFKLVPPALEALAADKEISIDGFILPGHVSVITGVEAYGFLPKKYETGGVIAGFEPLDILLGIKRILEQICEPQIINEYSRVVKPEGNMQAKDIMYQVFEVGDSVWRGLGLIPKSGLAVREEFSHFDASVKYGLKTDAYEPENQSAGCRCGDVLKGKIIPVDCPLFKKICSPDNPLGPCMVSSEGSCAAYYHYE